MLTRSDRLGLGIALDVWMAALPRPGTAIAKHTRESLCKVLPSAARDHMMPLITKHPPTGAQKHEGIVGAAAAIDFLRRPDTEHTPGQARASYAIFRACVQELRERLWSGLREIAGVTVHVPLRVAPRMPTCAPAAPATRRWTSPIACSTGSGASPAGRVRRAAHGAGRVPHQSRSRP